MHKGQALHTQESSSRPMSMGRCPESGMVVQACNSNPSGQQQKDPEFEASLDYIVRPWRQEWRGHQGNTN